MKYKGAKYRCSACREKRHGGYENTPRGKRWVCNICYIEESYDIK